MSSSVSQRTSLSATADKDPEWFRKLRHNLSEQSASIHLPEFFAGGLMAWVGTAIPGIPAVPISYVAIIVILGLGFMKRPAHKVPPTLTLWTIVLFLGYIFAVLVSAYQDYASTGEWIRRLSRISVVVVLAYIMSTGRINYSSIVKGFIAMLILNVPLFYAGVVSHNYGHYLTGILNDKNQSGYNYAIGGILCLLVYKNPWVRWGVFCFFGLCLWLTGSRTSLAGYAVALIWMLLSRRVSVPFKIILAGALAWSVWFVEKNFAQSGGFSERAGSDWFRQRIDDASVTKIDDSPWWGQGLGQAFVTLDHDRNFFFHNNYLSLLIEGGWPFLLVVVGFTVWVGMRVLRHQEIDQRRIIAQGATIAMLVCAWKLGDVFLTTAWALVMAAGIRAFIYEDNLAMARVRSLSAEERRRRAIEEV